MKLHCPHCGVAGSADSSYSGRQVRCPKCNTSFELTPGLSAGGSDDSSTIDFSSPVKLLCPHCGVDGVADESYGGKTVRCPLCSKHFQLDRNLAVDTAGPPSMTSSPQPEKESPAAGDDVLAVAAPESMVQEIAGQTINAEFVESEGRGRQEGVIDGAKAVLAYKLPGYTTGTAGTGDRKQAATAKEPEFVPGEKRGRDDQRETAEEIVADQKERKEEAVEDVAGAELLSSEVGPQQVEETGNETEPVAAQAGTIEQEPYGIEVDQCWQCARKDNFGQTFINRGGRLYCRDCAAAEDESEAAAGRATAFGDQAAQPEGGVAEGVPYYDFSIGEALREAWEKTRGAKGTIWKGSVALLILALAGEFLFPSQGAENQGNFALLSGFVIQTVMQLLSFLFTAGLLYMGVRRAAGDPIEWRMAYRGFSCAGKVIVASILQSVLISVGILALVLPGIYLAVGYSMVLPLIVDRGMSPWQAMETSRKAVHKIWWKVAGLLSVMGLITLVAIILMGIGLIWTWPMFIILAGVIFRYLFGSADKAD